MTKRTRDVSLLAVLILSVACVTSGSAAPSARLTTDPQPPLGLDLALTSLQKNASGGIATLLLTVRASVGVEGAVLTAKTPANLVFADGSAVKTWALDLTAPGASLAIPVDVIVPDDGRYIVSAEITGNARGKSIHRGAAHRLLVGVEEQEGEVRGKAIEYLAAEAVQAAQ